MYFSIAKMSCKSSSQHQLATTSINPTSPSSYTYTWLIENYTLLKKETGEYLSSPTFHANYHKWHLRLYPNGSNNEYANHISLFMYYESSPNNGEAFEGEQKFSILDDQNESVETLNFKFNFKEHNDNYGFHKILSHNVLINKPNILLAKNSLKIFCELTVISSITSNIITAKSAFRSSYSLADNQNSNSLENIFLNEEFSDVTLETKDGKSLKTHKCILAAGSPVFLSMFRNDMLESKLNVVRIPDIEYDVLKELLRYVYSMGQMEIPNSLASQLFVAADKYDMSDLKDKCAEVLCDNITVINVISIFHLAKKHNVDQLKERAMIFLRENFKDAVNSDEVNAMAKENDYTSSMLEIMRSLIN